MRLLFLVFFFMAGPLMAKPLVVTSFSILGDMVHEIGQDKIEVKNLVGPNEDAHVYEPRPQDAKALGEAALVIVNGLGFEGWLNRLIESSGFKGPVLVASTGVAPLMHAAKGHQLADPHAWHSLKNAPIYVDNIVRALSALLPKEAGFFEAQGSRYKASLAALEQEGMQKFAHLSVEQRKVITSHAAFAYLGEAFHLQFFSPTGMSTESEPSAKAVAFLIRKCREENIKALFMENITNPKLIQQIAEETGIHVGGVLYSDALSPPGTEADTYLKMMTHNIEALAKKLKN